MPDKQYSTSWQSAKQKAKDRTRQRNPSQIGYNIVSDMKRLSIKGANEITPQETTNLNMKAIKGMPMFSPVRGNTFTKVMADVGGDYEKAKEILANNVATMKSEYGTGAPTKMHRGVPHGDFDQKEFEKANAMLDTERYNKQLTPQDKVTLEKKRKKDLKNINRIISS